jgi:GTP-binding protein
MTEQEELQVAPVVAVVGRPNVGKSTLVNRILGRREAVVQDVPGVTRDRIAYDALWNGRRFTLVDTGGWEPDARGLQAMVSAQAERAAAAADVVLFVVDGRTGATETDLVVARTLRRAKRPVVLAVTKVDDEQYEPDAAELWSLGLGEPFAVSGLHGRGSGDLLDAVLALLPDAPMDADEESGPRRVALVGRPNVGKSSLLNRLTGEDRAVVDAVAGTTIDPVDSLLELGGEVWRFVDTAGLRRRVRQASGMEYYASLRTAAAIEAAEVAVVLLDASERLSEQDQRVIAEVVEAGRALVLALNKWDLLDEDRREQLEKEIARDLARVAWAPRVNVSARTGVAHRAAFLGRPDPDRPAEHLAHRRGRADPAAAARGKGAAGAVRDAGRHPSAALRAVHHRFPRGGIPPLHRTSPARGLRLHRHAHRDLGTGPRKAQALSGLRCGRRQPLAALRNETVAVSAQRDLSVSRDVRERDPIRIEVGVYDKERVDLANVVQLAVARPATVRQVRSEAAAVAVGRSLNLDALEPVARPNCEIVTAGLQRPDHLVAAQHEPRCRERRSGNTEVGEFWRAGRYRA